jgi:Interleukin-like EMT inducer
MYFAFRIQCTVQHYNTFNVLFILAECLIESVSWGLGGAPFFDAYIAFNGYKTVSTRPIFTEGIGYTYTYGFTLVELNVISCSSSKVLTFDTFRNTNSSDNMATYINSLPLCTLLVGITTIDAQQSMTPKVKSALLAIGVNVTELKRWGKASFVAQIGQPSLTVSQVDPPGGSNAKLTAKVSGTSHCRS